MKFVLTLNLKYVISEISNTNKKTKSLTFQLNVRLFENGMLLQQKSELHFFYNNSRSTATAIADTGYADFAAFGVQYVN